MNERLPYEEELSRQLNDLPLPDENVSWEDMKQRLEKDDDDGGIVPPVFKGCLGYGLLLILLAIILFFIARPDKWVSNKKEKNIVSSKKINARNHQDTFSKKETKDLPTGLAPESENKVAKNADSANHNIEKYVYHDSLMIADKKKSEEKRLLKKNNVPKESAELHTENINRRPRANKKSHQKNMVKTKNSEPNEIADDDEQKIDSSLNRKDVTAEKTTLATIDYVLTIDSTIKESPDSALTKKNPNDTSNNILLKKDSKSKRSIYFAAGIALHQLVPISGQKFVPYNSLGRKGTLADYIPSIYFRMYKDQKWFVQTEFKYGAPQYNKEIL